MPVVPKLNAMLMCDLILVDELTKKKSLIGIFHAIHAESFPCTHPSMFIYVQFTDAAGEYNFTLDLVDLSNNKVLGKGHIPPLTISDRLQTHDLIFNLRDLTFDHPGKYEFRISTQDTCFGNKIFWVKEKMATSKEKTQ
jgi:hypothetical protein